MMKSRSFRIYAIAVAASLAIHLLVVGGLLLVDSLILRVPEKQVVNIEFLSPEEVQQLTGVEKVKKPLTLPSRQIVEQSENSVHEEEVDTRFLSAKNQKVQKQTIAKERGQFENLKKSTTQQRGAKGNGRPKTISKQEQESQIAKEIFKNFDASAALERQKISDKIQSEGLGEGRGSGAENDGTGETAKSNDYVKDVDQGLETMLNTREFKYYSYYNRIRRQLAQHWERKVREKLTKIYKEGRSPAAANQDRITKLMIVLNDQGTLVRVQVLSDSGVSDLDDAAIEAFRQAAPFPNPPKGIVEQDGTVKIRWDFVLEV